MIRLSVFILLVALLHLSGVDTLHAAISDDCVVRFVPIARKIAQDRTNRTPYRAIVRLYSNAELPPDVWIPSEVLTDLNVKYDLNKEKTVFTFRLQNPAAKLGVPSLKQLAPKGLDLDFRALSEDNRIHFNLNGMERVTGLGYELADVSHKPATPPEAALLIVGKEAFMRDAMERGARRTAQWREEKPEKLQSPFNLVWDHVRRENRDLTSGDALPGVRVISPTWFALTDESGALSNLAGASYVPAAHAKGYHVWALVSNGFKKKRTTDFLKDPSAQNRCIARLLAYAALYGFDGINVDFENVANDDAARLTAFVRKLSTEAAKMKLKMSIDIMIPTNWSKCYDRKSLAKIVDYVAVMTYDEHWSSAPRAGSTASLPWTEAALKRTLADVPPQKLLLGIPLYTREWEETRDKNGKVKVKSKAFSMASVDARLRETSADKRWLSDKGQHYFDYVSDDKTYRIWIEDTRSLALRMDLVEKNALAGAAFWRKGFEHREIWDEIEEATERMAKERARKEAEKKKAK
jgi:Predicted glycosyl hydrolase